MTELATIENINLEKVEKQGRKLYTSNPFYRNLVNVMEHPEFREFLDKGETWTEMKTMLMFVKSYQKIEKMKPALSGYQKLAVLDSLMKEPLCRQEITRRMMEWSEDKKGRSQPKIKVMREIEDK